MCYNGCFETLWKLAFLKAGINDVDAGVLLTSSSADWWVVGQGNNFCQDRNVLSSQAHQHQSERTVIALQWMAQSL